MRERIPAHEPFFPAAALYAAAALPWSIASMRGWVPPALPGLAMPAGHAHEMLFGFLLAAVAGNQLGPLAPRVLAAMVAAWLAARASFVAAPFSMPSLAANAVFAGLLAWQLLPRLTASIRKWRNRSLPAAVLALCATAVAMQAAPRQDTPLAAVVLMALLMLFMGGRILAPAAAGHWQRAGESVSARVQPRLEGALIVLLAAAIAAIASGVRMAAGALLAIAAIVATVRLARWRPWTLRRRRDLVGLAVGYAWLGLGLGAIGAALLGGVRPVGALHLVTVGAAGTLTVQVMTLTWARLARVDPARLLLPAWATGAIALATMARVAADLDGTHAPAWLAIAASAWSAAYALVLATFARIGLRRAA